MEFIEIQPGVFRGKCSIYLIVDPANLKELKK